jgi:hypothetical protein
VAGNLIPSGTTLGDPGFEVQPLPQTKAAIDTGHQRADAYQAHQERAPATHAAKPATDEANELALARKALQGGAARDKVIARLRERGFGHLANKL